MTNRTIVWILLGGGLLCLFVLTLAAVVLTMAGGQGSADFSFGDRIQIVDVQGELTDSRAILEQLKRYEDADSVPAILLNVDSPGGDVATSQELYREVLRLREEKGKVVVAYLSSVGASGAYYVACAADRIISSPGSIVGSIGVIGQWLNYGELLEWAMISDIVFKTGEFKDTGNPLRELTPEEEEYFQGLIDDMYVQFVEAVALGRSLDVAEVRDFSDGRVFTGRQAMELDMIDEIGNFQDAVDLTAELASIDGTPRLLEAPAPTLTLMDLLAGDISDFIPFARGVGGSELRFQYLWR
jgi:protease-4